MKKLITALLVLVMLLGLASCDFLPEDLQATINGMFGEHTHEFVEFESKKASCDKDGYVKYKCECGEESEEILTKLGHDVQYKSTIAATCTADGSIINACTRCSYTKKEPIPKLGHEWGEFEEYSRLIACTREKCSATMLAESDEAGKYEETLVFNFGDTEKAELDAVHEELATILANAEKYDPTKHPLATSGDLYDEYKDAEALYEKYSDLIFEAQGQYSIAMTLYYCDHRNEDLQKIYNDMQTYYTDLVAKFYSLSTPWHESKFREFFFEGATEEEINAFLFDSNAYSNEEYAALKNRNDAIELEFNGLTDVREGSSVPTLYYEFVQNNKKIAEILGYENYLEYAYENVYDRDYTYQDAAIFVNYVKQYIVPLYNSISDKSTNLSGYNQNDVKIYREVMSNSFFSSALANQLLNDYIDEMNMAFTSNPDKQISFSDTLNALMVDGNLFRGTYKGAYVTYIRGVNVPIAYFGSGYDSATTIAHEFGHYLNEIYNDDMYNQSFDLLETHSQGQESLFIQYVLNNYLEGKTVDLVSTDFLQSLLQTIVLATQVNCFEQAVYLDYYDGYDSERIMADGTITANEYDTLFAAISADFGINRLYRADYYWRYVTIGSPCYYISYAVSGVNALQIYAKVENVSFDAAKDSYLKLFTYTDENPDMTLEQVLTYAGLTSYTDEETFKAINRGLK